MFPLRPNAQDLTLDINFGCIQYHHSPGVRLCDPYASYFACRFTSNHALLHLAQLVWSQGLEVQRCIVEGEPESKRIYYVGVPMGWSMDEVVCWSYSPTSCSELTAKTAQVRSPQPAFRCGLSGDCHFGLPVKSVGLTICYLY